MELRSRTPSLSLALQLKDDIIDLRAGDLDSLGRYRQVEQAFSVWPHDFEREVNVTDTPTPSFSRTNIPCFHLV